MEKPTAIFNEVNSLFSDSPAADIINDLDEVFGLAMTNPKFKDMEATRADNLRYGVRLVQKFIAKADKIRG